MRRTITNGDSPRWTTDEDNFLRVYAGLPMAELQTALNKKLRTHRTLGAVTKHSSILRKRDKAQMYKDWDSEVTLSLSGVTITGKLSPVLAKKVFNDVVFS